MEKLSKNELKTGASRLDKRYRYSSVEYVVTIKKNLECLLCCFLTVFTRFHGVYLEILPGSL